MFVWLADWLPSIFWCVHLSFNIQLHWFRCLSICMYVFDCAAGFILPVVNISSSTSFLHFCMSHNSYVRIMTQTCAHWLTTTCMYAEVDISNGFTTDIRIICSRVINLMLEKNKTKQKKKIEWRNWMKLKLQKSVVFKWWKSLKIKIFFSWLFLSL